MQELTNNTHTIDLNAKVIELDAVVNTLNDRVNKLQNKPNQANEVNQANQVNQVNQVNQSNQGILNSSEVIDNLTKPSLNFRSLQKGILFFYLILLGNYTAELLGCKVQRLFDNNQFAKHVVGFISLYFFVFMNEDVTQDMNPGSVLLISVAMYLWFVVSAKMDDMIWFTSLVLLFLIAVIEVFNKHVESKLKKKREKNKGSSLTGIDKFMRGNGPKIQEIMTYTIVGLTIIGLLVYIGMKKMEYKTNWSWYTFFLGVPECAMTLGSKRENEAASINKYLYFIKKAFN